MQVGGKQKRDNTMSVNLERVEGFAELFHHHYSALAPDFGCPVEEKPEWRKLTLNERRRIVAATRLALIEAGTPTTSDERMTLGHQGTEGRECGC